MTRALTGSLIMLAAVAVTAAHAADCYAIKDPDAKQTCRAETP